MEPEGPTPTPTPGPTEAPTPAPTFVLEERNFTVVSSAMSMSGITVAQVRIVEPAIRSGIAVSTGVPVEDVVIRGYSEANGRLRRLSLVTVDFEVTGTPRPIPK